MHNDSNDTRRWRAWMPAALLALLAARCWLMWAAPLADTTEARYGELARQTVTHGYWLMPHMDAATPFFAKPPLSTWSSAAFMTVFGISEFAARLPSLLLCALTVWIAMAFAGRLNMTRRWLVAPVLATSPLFYVTAGTVMTDAMQMTIIFAAQYFAWRALDPAQPGREAGRRWRLAFWAMIGLGALAKGLATWALIGMPLVVYAVWQRQVRESLMRLLDAGGIALALAICVPWYVAAERAYPGFLRYFIVGEHFARFLEPGWTGDRYGTAHRQPIGAIWFFWATAILPWLGVFFSRLALLWQRNAAPAAPHAALNRYLWSAILTPLLFFTFSRNIIWTYALTAIPPFAVLAAQWLQHATLARQKTIAGAALAWSLVLLACAPLLVRQVDKQSDRLLAQAYQRVAPPGSVLEYRCKPQFSSAFYGRDHIAFRPLPDGKGDGYAVVDNSDITRLNIPPERVTFAGNRRSLIRELP
jgi:4-amino-4-deoxy-L-arabinose transferase-like glycosyltransferase